MAGVTGGVEEFSVRAESFTGGDIAGGEQRFVAACRVGRAGFVVAQVDGLFGGLRGERAEIVVLFDQRRAEIVGEEADFLTGAFARPVQVLVGYGDVVGAPLPSRALGQDLGQR